MTTFEVDEITFEIKVFVEGQEPPMLVQPYWPDGTEWSSREEAEDWATLFVAAHNDETAPYPPVSPGDEPIEREVIKAAEPTPVEE